MPTHCLPLDGRENNWHIESPEPWSSRLDHYYWRDHSCLICSQSTIFVAKKHNCNRNQINPNCCNSNKRCRKIFEHFIDISKILLHFSLLWLIRIATSGVDEDCDNCDHTRSQYSLVAAPDTYMVGTIVNNKTLPMTDHSVNISSKGVIIRFTVPLT